MVASPGILLVNRLWIDSSNIISFLSEGDYNIYEQHSV